MDSTLHDARLTHRVQRCVENPEVHTVALDQQPHVPGEPSLSDGESVRAGDEEVYERVPTWQRAYCPVESEA